MTALGSFLTLLPGCGKPTSTQSYPSQSSNLSIVVENFEGNGPLGSDFTSVYAVLQSGERTIKKLILDGEYLGVSQVKWTGPGSVSLCISKYSATSSFRNIVTLIDGRTSVNVNTVLNQECDI